MLERPARAPVGAFTETESRPVIPTIVLLGNLLVDDVVLADGTTRMGQPGGALLYGALGATVWQSRPGLVSILGDDYPTQVLEKLQQRGVDLTGAGDAFGVGLVLAHLEGLPINACLQRAVVTASFAVAGCGPDALWAATPADAENRLRQWYDSEGQP
jgi:sugar/nucleoside kinase (ribokinase family)